MKFKGNNIFSMKNSVFFWIVGGIILGRLEWAFNKRCFSPDAKGPALYTYVYLPYTVETAHAFAVLDVRKFDPEEIIVFNCSGRGDKDLSTYIDYFKL